MEPSTTPTLTDLLTAAAGRLAAALDGYENGDEVKSLATAYGILRDKQRQAGQEAAEQSAAPYGETRVKHAERAACHDCSWTNRGVPCRPMAAHHAHSHRHVVTVTITLRG